MAKTAAPHTVTIPKVGTVVLNAMPDPFDERDLEYRPRLEPLAPSMDNRDLHGRFVMNQGNTSSCTGHALASVINTVLARSRAALQPASARGNGRRATPPRVSPYMLYWLARRYDEFAGEADEGSSLRGALKGWFHHGIALRTAWPTLDIPERVALEDPEFQAECRTRPLGAFYRVQPYRLDDMQSAINELHAIAVSANVHDGWLEPVVMRKGKEKLHLIKRTVDARSLGGHAFAIVGYNEVGFLVQNSWGTGWGKKGFATLAYEDWLDSAYDAWVTRPGVPHTPFAAGRSGTVQATAGELATGKGPDLRRLAHHVVNLGNNGQLSTNGTFASTPVQVDGIFTRMAEWHGAWLDAGATARRDIVLFAHGGLVSERAGLDVAQKHLNWWLNNHVYPVYFAWQSGPAETLLDQLSDVMRQKQPAGGIGFDLAEQFDRLVEKFARSSIRWMWDEMKENARLASQPIPDGGTVAWPPASREARAAMAGYAGATLTISRLARYVHEHETQDVRIHLVGHSAGSIFLAPLLDRLADFGLTAHSVALLAPAIRVDEFLTSYLPRLHDHRIRGFSLFAMSDQRELDDTCGAGKLAIYRKSLLYLVARALERAIPGQSASEIPILGMQKFFDQPVMGANGQTLRALLAAAGGTAIFSRSAAPADARSDSTSHGGFDDDPPTMTSVLMRMLQVQDATRVSEYAPHSALDQIEPGAGPVAAPRVTPAAAPPVALPTAPRGGGRGGGRGGVRAGGRTGARAAPMMEAAVTLDAGAGAVAQTAQPQRERPVAPAAAGGGPNPDVAVAPRSGSPTVDMLACQGWSGGNGAAAMPRAARPTKAAAKRAAKKPARSRPAATAKRRRRKP
ncbi:MAG TPA: C1 family peptidase [Gemmatimonadaceae bacterium]|nr:C1 family peptidase [Gemmatimonadaceae bacterium]